MTNKGNSNHLTLEDRSKIEYGLNKGHSIREISREIKKSPSSVLREIHRNCNYESTKLNDCIYLGNCYHHHACGNMSCTLVCSKRCKATCYKRCSLYEKHVCAKLHKSPYVCNGCSKVNFGNCRFDRILYSAKDAHERYRNILTNRRAGFDLTLEELMHIDKVVSPLIKKGQSPYHILQSQNLGISLSTLYRIIESGELDARDIDLTDKVSRKPRKTSRRKKAEVVAQIREAKLGHLYHDFLDYMNEHDTFYVEMDCVEGKRGEEPALLTLHYPSFHFQYAVYLPKHDSENVITAFNEIEESIGTELFRKMFPVILTDNGSEFSDVLSIETSCLDSSIQRTKLFFCEPNRSDEKGACENNHKLIRRVIPKGTSLLDYSNLDIVLMMNHINSYRRESALGKSAFDLIDGIFPQEFLDILGCYRIPDSEIILSPRLFSKKK